MGLSSRVLTEDACFADLVQRAEAKARWQPRPARGALALDEPADNLHADEEPAFEGFALVAGMADWPTLAVDEQVWRSRFPHRGWCPFGRAGRDCVIPNAFAR
jgi:hypothetical protein